MGRAEARGGGGGARGGRPGETARSAQGHRAAGEHRAAAEGCKRRVRGKGRPQQAATQGDGAGEKGAEAKEERPSRETAGAQKRRRPLNAAPGSRQPTASKERRRPGGSTAVHITPSRKGAAANPRRLASGADSTEQPRSLRTLPPPGGSGVRELLQEVCSAAQVAGARQRKRERRGQVDSEVEQPDEEGRSWAAVQEPGLGRAQWIRPAPRRR